MPAGTYCRHRIQRDSRQLPRPCPRLKSHTCASAYLPSTSDFTTGQAVNLAATTYACPIIGRFGRPDHYPVRLDTKAAGWHGQALVTPQRDKGLPVFFRPPSTYVHCQVNLKLPVAILCKCYQYSGWGPGPLKDTTKPPIITPKRMLPIRTVLPSEEES